MQTRYEAFKAALASSVGDVSSSTFTRRLAVYERARQLLKEAHAKPDDALSLEKAIRETETEAANLSRRHIELLARRARLIVWPACTVIALLFTAVQLREIPFASLLGTIDPTFLFKLTVTAYFIVMGAGFSYDIETQKQIYLLDPEHGRLSRNSIAAIAIYLVTAAILFAASRSYTAFAVALLIWHFSGMYFWRVGARQTAPLLADSTGSAALRGDYFALQRLQLVREYMTGKWHGPRHTILSVLVLLFVFFAVPNRASSYLTSTLRSPGLSVADAQIPAYLFLAYAVIGEGCTWLRRFAAKISLRVLDALDRQYTLHKRPISDLSDSDPVPPLW